MSRPLYTPFNQAVIDITNRLFPCGYDVASIAPETLAGLTEHIQRTGRVLVWDGASDRTVFGDPEVNWAFRAWHDFHHYRLQAEFNPLGERRVAYAQINDVRRLYGHGPIADFIVRLVLCEVLGQLEYHERHNDYPADQWLFAQRYLADPARAVRLAA